MSFHGEMYEKGRVKHELNVKMSKLEPKYTKFRVEINGIPQEYDEDVTNIISRMSKFISYEIQEKDIIDARRIQTRCPRPVTAQLRSNKVRKHFLRALTRYNEEHKDNKLNSADLGFSGDPIPILMSVHPSKVNKYHRRETRWNAREMRHSVAFMSQAGVCSDSYDEEEEAVEEVEGREWMVEDELEEAQDFQALRFGGWDDAEEENEVERDGERDDDEEENEVERFGEWEVGDEENEVGREDAEEENDVEREDAAEDNEVNVEREDMKEEEDEENEMERVEDGEVETEVERVADGKALTEVERVADGKAKTEVEKVGEREDGDENNDEKFVRDSEVEEVMEEE